MMNKILSIFKSNKKVDLQAIQQMQTLDTLKITYDEYRELTNQGRLEDLLLKIRDNEDVFSNNEVIAYLGDLFQSVTAGLKASTLDAKSIEIWSRVLREILVSIHYTGEFLEIANNIKEKLDDGADIVKCTRETKDLLVAYSSGLTEDHEDMHGYLVDIAGKLQSIYSDVVQAKDEYFSRESVTGSINNSFEQGIKQLGESIESSNNINDLKNNLNHIVIALQEKIVQEVEAEESETKILENKIAGMSNKIKSLENHAKDLEKAVRQKHMEAITDPLTGLYNRAAYVQALENAWMKWQHDAVPSTMLVWDIDHFKSINDRHGHAAGDRVLQSVAKKLETGVRKGDILARFGGEEFVMLLADKTLEEGLQLAERIRVLISQTEFSYKQQHLRVTISCGVASFVKKDTPTTIFERADKALYKAKRSGRDRVEALKVA